MSDVLPPSLRAVFVLIHSPLVGATSLEPTARALERRGVACHLPALRRPETALPPWRELPAVLTRQLQHGEPYMLVGHSAGGLLAAHLAATPDAVGLIYLDAQIAPGQGRVPPVEAAFHDVVRRLAEPGGLLPPWSAWWRRDIFAGTAVDSDSKRRFEAEQPRLPLSWFDDAFEMADWSACPAGYLQTSAVFASAADDAIARGWPTLRLDGSHLHPFLEPDATAVALLEISRQIRRR